VLLEKVAGRTTGIAGPVSVAFLVIAGIGLVDHGLFDPHLLLGPVFVPLFYVGVLVSMAVSISVVVSRKLTAEFLLTFSLADNLKTIFEFET